MAAALAQVLREFMDRAKCGPDVLAHLTGVSRSTIIHWLKEEGKKPRNWRHLVIIADALRLNKTEATRLLHSAGHPSIAELLARVDNETDWELLARWAAVPPRQQFAALPLDRVPSPAPLPSGSRMPLGRNPLFAGRETELRALAVMLKEGYTAAVSQIAAATGMGGIGKTQLASEFVHRYGQYFLGGVFWLSFAQPSSVPAEIAACGGVGGLDLRPDFDSLPIKDQVRLVLAAWQSPVPRLLIFDNCEDEELLHQWRPSTGGCRILVTGRRGQWDTSLGVQVLSLDVLIRKESIVLLRKFRPDLEEDNRELHAIATELGDLPLALHLAGRYLARYKQSITPAAYLMQMQSSPFLHHPSMQGGGISPTNHMQSVARTFALSYGRLGTAESTDALAIGLLARASHFAPGELISHDLLLATAPESASVEEAAIALERLVTLGLLEVIEGPIQSAFRMHRLLVMFVHQVSSDLTAQSAVEEVMLATAKRLNAASSQMELLTLQSHFRTVTDRALERADERAADLCYELSRHLQEIDDYNGALYYNQRSLAIRTALYGEQHRQVVDNLNHMGWIFHVQWRYPEAQPYHERALEIASSVLDENDLTIAETLNYLGGILHAQDQYASAQNYYQRALSIRHHNLGDNHDDTAQSLNNLALLHHAAGRYGEALRYYLRALNIRERLFGQDHPKLAFSLNNLGYLLRAMGRYIEARPYLERALAIRERTLGPNNSYVATTLNHVGRLLHYTGDYIGAQPYIERALDIYEQSFGTDQPAVGHCLGNLGMLLFDRGEYTAARPYLERALTIHQERLGEHDRNTARSLNHLGLFLYGQGDLVKARVLLEQALAIRIQVLGQKHPDTGNSLGNLGMVLLSQEDEVAARQHLEQALAIHREVLGDSHPYTARSLDRMGYLFHAQGDYVAANKYLEQALTLYERVLSTDHPFTATCRGHLTELYRDSRNPLN